MPATQNPVAHPVDKLVVVGSGILGMLEVWYAYLQALEENRKLKVVMYEKRNQNDSTSDHIVPSFTPDELLSVVPRGSELERKLNIRFDLPGGIAVPDVNVTSGDAHKAFMKAVEIFSKDEQGYLDRTQKLLELGKLSMDLWQKFYDDADDELKDILQRSNFNPCREPSNTEEKVLHDGYRIDLIHNIPGAHEKAQGMINDYDKLGYKHCAVLSPAQAVKIDPALKEFCDNNSENNEWKTGTTALWRPGGCINAQTFLPLFREYLIKKMGTYLGDNNEEKNCFDIQYETPLKGLYFNEAGDEITGLNLAGRQTVKSNKYSYERSNYVFCPGEAVGTLDSLGLEEPAYAGFAGPTLFLNIPLEDHEIQAWQDFNHCKEYHKEGVVLAWQGRLIQDEKGDRLFLGVGGSKSYYGVVEPKLTEAFAIERNIMQLNAMNDVLPKVVSRALGRDTTGQLLTEADLTTLVDKGFAERWVGRRAVAYDGSPSVAEVYHHGKEVKHARATTHAGSGGFSFGHGLVMMSRGDVQPTPEREDLMFSIRSYTRTNRKP